MIFVYITFRMTLHCLVGTESLTLRINNLQANINSADTMVSIYKVAVMKGGTSQCMYKA